jgi:hypothetical protein
MKATPDACTLCGAPASSEADQVRQNTKSLRTENYGRWKAKPAPPAQEFEIYGGEPLRTFRMDPLAVERWHGFVVGEGLGTATGDAVRAGT